MPLLVAPLAAVALVLSGAQAPDPPTSPPIRFPSAQFPQPAELPFRANEVRSLLLVPVDCHADAEHLLPVGDWDGDGLADLAATFGAPRNELLVISLAPTPRDRAYVVLVRDAGRVLERGSWADVAPLGDVDGDGRPDLAAIVQRAQAGRQEHARLVALRAPDGAIAWSVDLELPPGAGAYELTDLDDVDRDGARDLAVVVRRGGRLALDESRPFPEPARVELRSGRDGHLLRTIADDASAWRDAIDVARAADADGDGIDDVALALGLGRVEVRSSWTGKLLRAVEREADPWSNDPVARLRSAADVDGDGIADLLHPGARVAVLRGGRDAGSAPACTWDPHAAGWLQDACVVDDLDGDGMRDLLGSFSCPKPIDSGGRWRIAIASARTGAWLCATWDQTGSMFAECKPVVWLPDAGERGAPGFATIVRRELSIWRVTEAAGPRPPDPTVPPGADGTPR